MITLETKQETLGHVLNRVRRNKHIPVRKITDMVGISRSTFTRIVSDQLTPNIAVLTKLMEILSITYDEIEMLIPGFDDLLTTRIGTVSKKFHELQDKNDAGSLDDFQKIVKETHQLAARMQTPGGELLYLYAQLLQAKLTENMFQQNDFAQQIFENIGNYAEWDNFELNLVADIISYLRETQLLIVLKRLDERNSRLILSASETFVIVKDDTMLYNVFDMAIKHHYYNLLVVTVLTITNRLQGAQNNQGGVMRKFAEVISALLENHVDEGLKTFARLCDNLLWLHPINQTRVDWMRGEVAELTRPQWQSLIRANLELPRH